jgi:hypothetical protein
MAVMNAAGLFTALLQDDTPVSLQQRILNHATANKDVELMVRLSRIASLDAEIDTALGKRPEAEVLLAWASRPGRTSEALIERFSKEKRATLLAELASRTDLSEALYLELARSESASVALAITTNTTAPIEARRTAAGRAVSTVRDSYSTMHRIKEILNGLPAEVAIHALERVTTPLQIAGLSQMVEDGDVLQLAVRMAAILETHDASWHSRNALHTVWERLSADERVVFQDGLRKVVANDQATETAKHHASEFVRRPALDPVSAAVKELATESDPMMLRKHYATASAAGYGQLRKAFIHAVKNPASPFDMIKEELRLADSEDLRFLSNRSDFDMSAAQDLLFAGGSAEAFDIFAAKTDALALARMFSGTGNAPGWLAHTELATRNPAIMLELYAAGYVISHPHTSEIARELLVTQLAEDDEKWLTFQRLLPEWDNTLTSLLDAVQQLS